MNFGFSFETKSFTQFFFKKLWGYGGKASVILQNKIKNSAEQQSDKLSRTVLILPHASALTFENSSNTSCICFQKTI